MREWVEVFINRLIKLKVMEGGGGENTKKKKNKNYYKIWNIVFKTCSAYYILVCM